MLQGGHTKEHVAIHMTLNFRTILQCLVKSFMRNNLDKWSMLKFWWAKRLQIAIANKFQSKSLVGKTLIIWFHSPTLSKFSAIKVVCCMVKVLNFLWKSANFVSLTIYRIAENVGRRKHWRIWQIGGQSPKFSPSNLWNSQYPYFIGKPFAKVISSK